nr:hypothetical protein [Microbacterium bovistercoris]
MIPGAFVKITVTRLRYPKINDHGVDIADYTATPTRHDIPGCWAEPIESTEVVDGRLAVRTGYTIAGPPNLDLVADDHIEYSGREYDVIGDVMNIPSVTSALAASKFTIVRWEG